MTARRLALVGLAGAAGCSDSTALSGDAYPIYGDLSSGALVMKVRLTEDGGDLAAVVDLMAPVTVVDPGADAAPLRREVALTLLGRRSASAAIDDVVPRASISTELFEFHPCADPTCSVGVDGGAREVGAIVGSPTLARFAPRFDLGAGTMTLLPSIAGDQTARSDQCDGVFKSPFRGGGNLIIGGAEVAFAGRRIVIAACLAPAPEVLVAPSERGTDVLLVQSTAVGPSIIDEAAYARYRATQGGVPPAAADLPSATVTLVSGPVTGGLAIIPTMALAGALGSDPRGACGDTYASHYLVAGDCPASSPNCPCNNDQPCLAPAIVELAPAAGVEFLVVPDGDATLQALRAELRPDEAEIDGILGTRALAGTEFDVDYPGSRLLWRCTDDASCTIRPELTSTARRDEVAACLP